MCVSYEEENTCVCHMRRRIHVCVNLCQAYFGFLVPYIYIYIYYIYIYIYIHIYVYIYIYIFGLLVPYIYMYTYIYIYTYMYIYIHIYVYTYIYILCQAAFGLLVLSPLCFNPHMELFVRT